MKHTEQNANMSECPLDLLKTDILVSHSFRNNRKNTKLTECISKLKEQNKPHSLKGSIKALALPYNQNIRKC